MPQKNRYAALCFATLFAIWSGLLMSGESTEVNQLLKCSSKPNCVCSEYPDDTAHFILPIDLPTENQTDVMKLLVETVREMGGDIHSTNATHIAATFTSSLFKFVDDLALRFDPVENRIHLRSASRVGYSDFGVNRRRAEQLRAIFDAKFSKG